MKKGLIRNLVSVVALLLILALFAGCSGTTNTTSSTSPTSTSSADNAAPVSGKTYTIGYLNWGQGVPILDSFETVAKSANDALGNQISVVSDKFTADQQLANVQNLISSGVSAIMFDGVVPTLIPDIAQKCADAKIPFMIYNHVPDATLQAQLVSNPYYIGSIGLDMNKVGGMLAQKALADGCKSAVCLGGAMGDVTNDQAINGFTSTFEAGGGKVLASARCTDPTEAPTKAEDLLSANSKADCVYSVTGDYTPSAYTAASNLGITPKIYSSCIDATTLDYIKNNEVAAGTDGTCLPGVLGYIMVENFLDGKPLKDANGNAPQLTSASFLVTPDTADTYKKCFLDSVPITAAEVQNLCTRYNSSVDLTYFTNYIKNLTLDSIAKTH